MFKRVLIANRGEIAVRIIRACEELDIETVAIFSEADENALHVQLADHAVCVGGADATDSYLNKDSILRAALETGADAIHPGYGFLSEDADFAQQVTEHGITWIGPMPETIRLVGDKDVARASMQPSGIPMAKGSEPLKNNKEAVKAAKEVGYPVILKPVSGGGGKGMYVAHDEDELKDILDTLVDLKKINYYFEHYIERSRHIEVQIVADNYGEVIHLGERECSIQRRNQKLLEESPSIALTHEMRKQVGTLAVKAAKSVHYSNVGTVEFLLDLKDNQFYFMEINPRIQVEHGVTEEVTGIDIVRTQIRIAAGEPLDITQADVHFQGHAIECRINAEDPDNNFMPSPGQITFRDGWPLDRAVLRLDDREAHRPRPHARRRHQDHAARAQGVPHRRCQDDNLPAPEDPQRQLLPHRQHRYAVHQEAHRHLRSTEGQRQELLCLSHAP